jgi:hypothetical protein
MEMQSGGGGGGSDIISLLGHLSEILILFTSSAMTSPWHFQLLLLTVERIENGFLQISTFSDMKVSDRFQRNGAVHAIQSLMMHQRILLLQR